MSADKLVAACSGELYHPPRADLARDPELYRGIVENALEVTGARLVVVSWLDVERQQTHAEAWGGWHATLVQRALEAARRIVPSFDPTTIACNLNRNCWVRWVYLDGIAVAVSFREWASGAVGEPIMEVATTIVGAHDVFVCPVRAAGEIVGAVSFYTAEPLDDARRATCSAFAKQVALTLDNARLAALARRRAGQAEQLAATLAEVGAATSVEEVVEGLLRGAVALLGGTSGVARRFGQHRGACQLVLRLRPDGLLQRQEGVVLMMPGSIGRKLQAGAPGQIVDDFAALDRIAARYGEEVGDDGARSEVAVPIVAGGERVGALHVRHVEPRFFGPPELGLATALAAQGGAVIERVCSEAARREAESAKARIDGALHTAQAMARDVTDALEPINRYAQHLAQRLDGTRDSAAAAYVTLLSEGTARVAAEVRQLEDLVRVAYGAGAAPDARQTDGAPGL